MSDLQKIAERVGWYLDNFGRCWKTEDGEEVILPSVLMAAEDDMGEWGLLPAGMDDLLVRLELGIFPVGKRWTCSTLTTKDISGATPREAVLIAAMEICK